MRLRRVVVAALATLALGGLAAACDEAEETVDDVQREVEEGVEATGARAAAETFRVSLRAQETDDAEGGVRAITALEEAANDLPGDPEVRGIEDGDGDGRDDDGFVEIAVGDEVACVTVPESGNEIDVTGEAC